MGLVLRCFLFHLRLTKITNLGAAASSPHCSQQFPGRFIFCGRGTKTWGRQSGAVAQPCCPILQPGKGTNPLQGTTWLRTFPSHLPGRGKCHSLPRMAPSGSILYSNHPPGAGCSPQATSQSVTVCSSAGGKHWEYKWEPGSFPGVISL